MRGLSVLFLFTCVLLSLLSNKAQAYEPDVMWGTRTVADLLSNCGRLTEMEHLDICFVMVRGELRDVGDEDAGLSFCPSNTPYADVATPQVINWLRQHPEVQSDPNPDGIDDALIALYGCRR